MFVDLSFPFLPHIWHQNSLWNPAKNLALIPVIDFQAICDIGNSTKGRVQGGYIGQKGIGFKSVFKISDQPQIRSAGFSFKFDSKQGPVGYILPEWIEDESRNEENRGKSEDAAESAIDDDDDTTSTPWTTSISLPLSSGRGIEIKSGFLDIHPTLLLFLHKLTSIRVVDSTAHHSVLVERRDEIKGNAQVLSLTTTTTATTTAEITDSHSTIEDDQPTVGETKTTVINSDWLLARKQLPLSELPSTYVTRPADQIRFTELALAFPLVEVASRDDDTDESGALQSLPVFAFLPLRSYGFDFVIQGE